MKSLLTILLLCALTVSNAQDVIIYKDGSEKKTKVLKINTSEVIFKKYNNLKGPEYTELKSNIFMIKYENGDSDVFNSNTGNNTINNTETNYTIFAGTNIELYLTHSISSGNLRNGDVIRFAVRNGITSQDGKAIIARNTYVQGQVVNAERARAGGVKGELDIMVSSVPTTNGKNIPVFLNIKNDGEDKEGEAFAVGMLLFWPALFMSGGEAEIAAGTSFLVQTRKDVSFNTSKLSQEQTNTPNIAYEQLNKADPCGERPKAPPTYNNTQYKKTPEYKVYYKKLRIWRNCTGN